METNEMKIVFEDIKEALRWSLVVMGVSSIVILALVIITHYF